MGIKRLMLIVFCGEDRKRRLPFVGGAVMSLIHLVCLNSAKKSY